MPAEGLPHVLRDYALLADGERGAVIGPRGDIAWLCVPHWDSPSVFASLLDAPGVFAVTPRGRYVWGGSYEPGSMIWRSRWVTGADSVVSCREALAFPGDLARAVLLRRVEAVRGPASVRMTVQVRADYGQRAFGHVHRDEGGAWTARSGDIRIRLTGAADARLVGDDEPLLMLDLDLAPGTRHDLVLELSSEPLPEPVDADRAWEATTAAWARAVPEPSGVVAPRDARQARAVLRGLTGSSGAMVAAATTSLPERAEAGRNYDYRYAWIRDQAFAGLAAAAAGADDLLDDAVRFVTARVLSDGDQLSPAYTTRGGAVPEQRHAALAGYPGGFDLIGNQVTGQFQLDAFGETLQLLAAAGRTGRLDADGWRAAQLAVEAIAKRWEQPDAGIWEISPKLWAHSRLSAVAGLRSLAAVPDAGADSGHWLAVADRLVAAVSATCTHPDGRWQRAPDDLRVDAALLLPPLRGALPAHDPRVLGTLQAVLDDLVEDGYVYRYRHDERPLGDAEGAFLLCGFLTSLALHQQGRRTDAVSFFQRSRAACGPSGLFTEEYDVRQRQLRGNLPQAFVHALLLESSAVLAQGD